MESLKLIIRKIKINIKMNQMIKNFVKICILLFINVNLYSQTILYSDRVEYYTENTKTEKFDFSTSNDIYSRFIVQDDYIIHKTNDQTSVYEIVFKNKTENDEYLYKIKSDANNIYVMFAEPGYLNFMFTSGSDYILSKWSIYKITKD